MAADECLPMIAAIPSPPWNSISLGPFRLHLYGLMLALGVLAAYKIAEIRYAKQGRDPADIGRISVVVVVSGVIGARVYHLFTGYKWHQDGLLNSLAIWKGGLSIWGAVAGGVIGLVFMARRLHLDTFAVLDACGPAVVVAQAIGRWGNYFNQELFGKPTSLPWGLEIDPAHRPANYLTVRTFQPTFLYESLWCLLVFGAIVWAERRFRFRKGQAFALYVAMYTFGRVFFEWMRVDPASRIFGIRFNLLLSAVLCVAFSAWFVILGRRPESELAIAPSLAPPEAESESERAADGQV
ncbi:MAG: prolipoprotein diacylglyceryl transferase [Actinomycetia bacterium]|nr:prolipoprotein diacylglyceryl transferase [Actinomycetes bacterium]